MSVASWAMAWQASQPMLGDGKATLSEVHSSLTRGGSSQGLSLLPQFYLIIWLVMFYYVLLSDRSVSEVSNIMQIQSWSHCGKSFHSQL